MENTKRLFSVDLLKALGAIGILIVHPIIWMHIKGDQGGLRFPQSLEFLKISYHSGVHFLPLFLPALAGITFYFAVKVKHISWADVVKRASALTLLGFVMNFLAWGSEDAFDWDVLQFIALCMIISFSFIKKMPAIYLLLLSLLSSFVVLFFSNSFPFTRFSHSYLYVIIFGDMLGENYWPLCPWFSVFASGIFTGVILKEYAHRLKILAVCGALFLIASALSGNFFPECLSANIWGPAIFKPSFFHILGIIGFSFLSVSLAQMSLSAYPKLKNALDKPLVRYYSKGILWIYLVIVIIGFRVSELVFSCFKLSYQSALVGMWIFFIIGGIISYFIGKAASRYKR